MTTALLTVHRINSMREDCVSVTSDDVKVAHAADVETMIAVVE